MSSTLPAAADQGESTRLRLAFLTLLVVSLLVLLFARLWFLQVMAGAEYADLAEGNPVRTVSLEAPRGEIFDRHGEPLVANRYAYVVGVQPEELGDEREEVLDDLADLLGTTRADLEAEIEASRVSPLRPRPVAVDVPEELVLYIWENQSTRFPGVYAELLPRRQYPHGETAAHVLGYLTEIDAQQLEDERFEDYRPGDLVGRSGVEAAYEEELRGQEGLRRLEVTPAGNVIRQIDEVLPTAGDDLRLTIDLDVQRSAEDALREGIEVARQTPDERGISDTLEAPGGAVVVLDADTAEVRAMASYPAYDPSEFVGGVSHEYFDSIVDPEQEVPILNRAIQSSFPPGSVWKIVTASAALEHGYMAPSSTLPCPPTWEWNEQTYANWSSTHSGHITMTQSLVESCNTVYYELARQMWNDEREADGDEEILSDHARLWGFGEPTGVDLPQERSGVVPGRQWKREFWEATRDANCANAEQAEEGSSTQELYEELCSELGARWRGGDAVNMSTGQGDVQTTPLQIANAYAAVANGGTLHAPRVVDEVLPREGGPVEVDGEVLGELGLEDSTLQVLRDGLAGVTVRGTADDTFAGMPTPIAGKTGTAQFGRTRQPYAWFVGYNVEEHDGERLVVAAVVEEGGGGNETAAPIVRRVFEEALGLDAGEIQPGEATD